LFDRHGGKVVFFGRFVSVIRTYAAAAAGIMGLPRRRFVLANTTGGLLWAGLFSFGAYELGSAASRVGTVASFVGAGLAAVVFVGFALVTRSSVRWLERRALAAYPDDSVAGRGVELAFK
jgi:membrane protein DedA with SNARE-associated domain